MLTRKYYIFLVAVNLVLNVDGIAADDWTLPFVYETKLKQIGEQYVIQIRGILNDNEKLQFAFMEGNIFENSKSQLVIELQRDRPKKCRYYKRDAMGIRSNESTVSYTANFDKNIDLRIFFVDTSMMIIIQNEMLTAEFPSDYEMNLGGSKHIYVGGNFTFTGFEIWTTPHYTRPDGGGKLFPITFHARSRTHMYAFIPNATVTFKFYIDEMIERGAFRITSAPNYYAYSICCDDQSMLCQGSKMTENPLKLNRPNEIVLVHKDEGDLSVILKKILLFDTNRTVADHPIDKLSQLNFNGRFVTAWYQPLDCAEISTVKSILVTSDDPEYDVFIFSLTNQLLL